MTKNKIKVTYSFTEETTVGEGDLGEIATTYTQEQGEWPNCVAEKGSFISSDSSKLEFKSVSCTCGKHIVFWAVIPQGVLPGKAMKILLITEKQYG